MKWFVKLQKDSKVVLIIGAILILISGLRAIYANVNGENRLETLKRNSNLNLSL